MKRRAPRTPIIATSPTSATPPLRPAAAKNLTPPPHPLPFLEILAHKLDSAPGLTGLCAGFESGEWRAEQLAGHMMKWLPEFALRYTEWTSIGADTALEQIVRAAKAVYTSDNFKRRGEFGELLLHMAIRQVFNSTPAVSKIFFKDAANQTVNGFDAVHVVQDLRGDLELWLGEVKFYTDINGAIASVTEELQAHTRRDYMRAEFTAIRNKLDPAFPHSEELQRLLHENTTLDKIFSRICIPVLLTYDSPCVSSHTASNKTYLQEIEAELTQNYSAFSNKLGTMTLRVHLFLLPMNTKDALVTALDRKLKTCQKLV